MALKRASTGIVRLDLGDGDWIDVHEQLSKREYSVLAAYFPDRTVDRETGISVAEGVELQTGLFKALAVAWSADMPCHVDEYLALEADDAQRIDVALAEYFQRIMPTPDEGKAATT